MSRQPSAFDEPEKPHEPPRPRYFWDVSCGNDHLFIVPAGTPKTEALLMHRTTWLGKIPQDEKCDRLWEECGIPRDRVPLVRTAWKALMEWLPDDIEPLRAILKERYEIAPREKQK